MTRVMRLTEAFSGAAGQPMTKTAHEVLCNREQRGCSGRKYDGRVMPIGHVDTGDRLACIERLIEHYRLEAIRRLERRTLALWRNIEARQALAKFEKPLERIH